MSDPSEIKFVALSNLQTIGNSVWIGSGANTPTLNLSESLLPDYAIERRWQKFKAAMTALIKRTFVYSFFVVFTSPVE